MAAPTNIHIVLKIAGTEVPQTEVHEMLVEQDLDQPDMCAITLSNESKHWSVELAPGAEIELGVSYADAQSTTPTFKGELVGIEPVFDPKAPARVILRALNKLHLLARGKKSVAFLNSSDKDIDSKRAHNYSQQADLGATDPSTWQTRPRHRSRASPIQRRP